MSLVGKCVLEVCRKICGFIVGIFVFVEIRGCSTAYTGMVEKLQNKKTAEEGRFSHSQAAEVIQVRTVVKHLLLQESLLL